MGQDLNSDPVNQAALYWLKEVGDVQKVGLHILDLAFWGLERKVRGEWPNRDQPAVEAQVGELLGWKPANAMRWLLSNPNGPSKEEQESNLVTLLEGAQSPRTASAAILNEIYSRQRAQNPALRSG